MKSGADSKLWRRIETKRGVDLLWRGSGAKSGVDSRFWRGLGPKMMWIQSFVDGIDLYFSRESVNEKV